MSAHLFAKHNMDNYIENILAENLTLKRQLESKSEALLILNKELAECKSERDQFKLMAEKLQEKCSAFKKMSFRDNSMFNDNYEQPLSPSSADSKDINRSLKFEVECLRQKLRDALGDVKALRSQLNEPKLVPSEIDSLSLKHLDKQEALVKQLEGMHKIKNQLEIDLQFANDEKEELIIERDAYKCKVHRLNHEFSVLLKGSNHSVIDIDSLIMENRFLQEHLQQSQEEINLVKQTMNRYKSMLEKKHNKGAIKLALENLSGIVLSPEQVQDLFENSSSEQFSNNAATTINELKTMCLALLENSNDKILALSHQKRANKILAAQICQLEQKIENIQGSQYVMFPSQVLLDGYLDSNVKDGKHNDKPISKNLIDKNEEKAKSDNHSFNEQ